MFNDPIRFVMTTFSFPPTLVSGLSIFFYSRLGFRSPMLKLFRLSVSVRDRFSPLSRRRLLSGISSVTKTKTQKHPLLFCCNTISEVERGGLSWSRTSGPRPCQPISVFSTLSIFFQIWSKVSFFFSLLGTNPTASSQTPDSSTFLFFAGGLIFGSGLILWALYYSFFYSPPIHTYVSYVTVRWWAFIWGSRSVRVCRLLDGAPERTLVDWILTRTVKQIITIVSV